MGVMTISWFPVFDLSYDRKALIMATLDKEELDKSNTEADEVEALLQKLCAIANEPEDSSEAMKATLYGPNGVQMDVVMTGGTCWGESPTELNQEITYFWIFCTNQTLVILDSYAQEDYLQTTIARSRAKRGPKKGKKPEGQTHNEK